MELLPAAPTAAELARRPVRQDAALAPGHAGTPGSLGRPTAPDVRDPARDAQQLRDVMIRARDEALGKLANGWAEELAAFTSPDAIGERPGSADDAGETERPDAGATGYAEALLERLPEDVRAKLRAFYASDADDGYWSPEATAGRIADFTISGYDTFEGGAAAKEATEASRRRFSEFIRPAIEQGVAGALAVLGDAPQAILDTVEAVRVGVMARLDTWTAGEESADAGASGPASADQPSDRAADRPDAGRAGAPVDLTA